MELEVTPIYADVERITKKSTSDKYYYWQAKVLIEEKEYDIFKLLSLDIVSNYRDNVGDLIAMKCFVPLGFYTKKLYANKDNLEINLYKKKVGARNEVISVTPYKAVLFTKDAPSVKGKDFDRHSEQELDMVDMLTIDMQLIDKSIEKLRLTTVGGIFRKTTTDAVARAILYQYSKDVLIDSKPSVERIDWVPTNNKQLREHILISQGTKLLDVPNYLHEKCGGLYPTAVGNYMQNKIWWIFPLYDMKRFDNEVRKVATIYKVPASRMSNIDKSWYTEDKKLFLLATGNAKLKDDANQAFLNEGSGFRQADSTQFMTATATNTKDNKTTIRRAAVNVEASVKDTRDGKLNAPLSKNQISSNKLKAISDIAARSGGATEITWDNSDHTELIPGMMIRFFFMDGQELKSFDGVLHYAHTFIQLSGSTLNSDRHTSSTYLAVFSDKISEEQ